MGRFILRRILISIPVLVGITIISFTATVAAPGDPLTARLDPTTLATLSQDQLNTIRSAMGLDQPIWIRYIHWLADVARGDLGFSITTHRAVVVDLTLRLTPTLMLMSTALLMAVIAGPTLGIIAAVKEGTWTDYVLTTLSAGLISVPGFVIGLTAIFLFAVNLHVLPSGGLVTLGRPFSFTDLLAHMAMPATILALGTAASLMRYTRAAMIEVLSSDYVTTARAKGLPQHGVLMRHALRNALIPIITILGLTLPELVAGAVVTEQVFNWPGMGQFAVSAAHDRDPAVLMGIVLLTATTVLVSNLAADILYAVVDPRIRLGARNG
jgi:peptide/nickel transport system permease protein